MPPETMPPETILIVDDDPICLAVAGLALRTAGFETRTAADGLEALDVLDALQPVLILSDIQMPNMDGFELARRTRQIPRFRNTPIVALTAFDAPDTEQRARDAGFTAYMKKPIHAVSLAARLRRLLEAAPRA
jgi:CheY-like chemotaxis protein